MDKTFNFISIGDIVTDAFITLKESEAEVVCDNTGKACKICMNFGDKIPYDSVTVVPAVGNSPNAAVCAHRLGLKSAVITNIGDDDDGKEAIKALNKNGVDTSFVTIHNNKKTNYHFVLRLGAERTILIKHEDYPYTLPDNLENPDWLYLSSLGENSLPFHKIILKYLAENPKVRLAFQPGTFQIKLGLDSLADIYKRSSLFFCNVEEAKKILNEKDADIKTLVKKMYDHGPQIVVITDGPNGAYTYDGMEIWHIPIYPDPKPPVDRTGAGDSFAATFTTLIAQGLSIPEALRRAPINSMSVVQYIGAQEGLLSVEALEKYLAEAPENYKLEKID